jgi:hypothetical protein
MLNSLYNSRGVAKYQVGNLTHSDSRQLNCLFPYTAPFYAQTVVGAGSFTVLAGTNRSYSLTLTATQETFFLSTLATTDTALHLSLINQFLPAGLTASVNAAGFLVIDTNIPGTQGLFTFTFDTVVVANTTVPVLTAPLQAGRFVVPVTDNINTYLGLPDSQNMYRYPRLGDSADLLASGVFVVKDAHINALKIYDPFEQGRVTTGTSFAGLFQGQIIPAFNTSSAATPTNQLFVDTVVNNEGKLTVFASGSTLAIPAGKLRVMSGSNNNSVGGLHEVRINY